MGEEMINTISHVAYSDESNWNDKQFRSICLISMPIEVRKDFEKEIQRELSSSGVTELKWEKIKSAKYRFAAEKVINKTINYNALKKIRLDILCWDIQDSRHNIMGRDDAQNLCRMYFHLFNNVLKNRWPDNSIWGLYPDEHNQIDWITLHETLDAKSICLEHKVVNIFNKTEWSFPFIFKKLFHIENIKPCKSHEEVLVQVADLFAGIACFSKKYYQLFSKWQEINNPQLSFFIDKEDKISLTKSQEERIKLLYHLNKECKTYKLGVSLDKYSCLKTIDPNNRLNFWWYEPQHELDKAPVRIKP